MPPKPLNPVEPLQSDEVIEVYFASQRVQIPIKPEVVLSQNIQAFNEMTGANVSEQIGDQKIRDNLTAESQEVCRILRERELITDEDFAYIWVSWQSSLVLQQDDLVCLAQFATQDPRVALEGLRSLQAELSDLDLQVRASRLIEQAEREIQITTFGITHSEAFLPRISGSMAERAEEAGFNTDTLIINRSRYQESSQQIRSYPSILATEETIHMISKLERLYGIKAVWLEEAMARYIGYNLVHKGKSPEIADSIKQKARVNDYTLVYEKMLKLVDGKTMLDLFFGFIPTDSEELSKIKDAINTIGILGDLVNSGMSYPQAVSTIQEMFAASSNE